MSRKQAMQSYLRAQSQAQEQRKILEERRAEAETSNKQLLEQESKLPKTTQRAMRFGGFAGLSGRKQVRVVTKARSEVGERKIKIGLFKDELRRFEEKELVPFEEEIKRFKKNWRF